VQAAAESAAAALAELAVGAGELVAAGLVVVVEDVQIVAGQFAQLLAGLLEIRLSQGGRLLRVTRRTHARVARRGPAELAHWARHGGLTSGGHLLLLVLVLMLLLVRVWVRVRLRLRLGLGV